MNAEQREIQPKVNPRTSRLEEVLQVLVIAYCQV